MRGGIILSNRLRAMQEAAENFGESVAGTREAQRKAKMEAEDRRIAGEDRVIRNKAAATQQEAADLQLGDFKRRDAARQEAEGLAGDLAGFGQAVPESEIDVGNALPGFQAQQSMRPVGDTTAQSLQDRIRASWMNADARAKGETSAFTAADIQKKRATEAEKSKREAEEFSLGLDKTRADIDKTKAGAESERMSTKKTKMEIDKLEKQMNAAGGASMAITKDNEGVWDKLFSGYRSDTKSTKDSLGQIRKLEALVNSKATGASDIATLYTFIRSFDSPNSAVREAEANMGQEAAGALNKLMNLRAKYEKGRILPDSVRQEMLEAVQTIKADHQSLLTATDARYGRLATSAGLDPSLIIDTEFSAAQGAGSPQAGARPAAGGSARSFKSAREAMAAGLPPGTVVMINGVEAEM
jgi:hypothetical protein